MDDIVEALGIQSLNDNHVRIQTLFHYLQNTRFPTPAKNTSTTIDVADDGINQLVKSPLSHDSIIIEPRQICPCRQHSFFLQNARFPAPQIEIQGTATATAVSDVDIGLVEDNWKACLAYEIILSSTNSAIL